MTVPMKKKIWRLTEERKLNKEVARKTGIWKAPPIREKYLWEEELEKKHSKIKYVFSSVPIVLNDDWLNRLKERENNNDKRDRRKDSN